MNKGESCNSLVRAFNLHRFGRFRDRSQEDLSIRASLLNLVVTTIIHWNAIYTGRVVDAMRNAGQAVREHLVTGLSLLEETPLVDKTGFRPFPFTPPRTVYRISVLL